MQFLQKRTNLIIFASVLFLFGVVLISSKNKPTVIPTPKTDSSQASLTPSPLATQSLTTTYLGKLPCADCEGIEEELTLTQSSPGAAEGTYTMKDTYLGKDVEPFVTKGVWTTDRGSATDENAVVVVLNYDKPGEISYFLRVGDNSLKMLDNDKKEIDSPFNQTLIKK